MNTVELVGHYGSDESHCLSAWTSTSRELTEEKRGRMGKLLKTLATDGHHSPFEKSTLHFLVTCDTASHIHIIKHRIAVSVNSESARYKELKEDKYHVPEDWPETLRAIAKQRFSECYAAYHAAVQELTPVLGRKRAKESARYFLPYANQLVLDVSFNFRSFCAFQKLRNEEHAQLEIREMAQEMLELVRETGAFPLSLEAFGYAV